MVLVVSGVTQTDYQGDAEKSAVKQSLVSSYNRVLAPKVRAGLTAAVPRNATHTGRNCLMLESNVAS